MHVHRHCDFTTKVLSWHYTLMAKVICDQASEKTNHLEHNLCSLFDHGWGQDLKVLVFLFWLANATSYHVVPKASGITCSKVAHKIIRVICFPPPDELQRTGAGFERLAFTRAAAASMTVWPIWESSPTLQMLSRTSTGNSFILFRCKQCVITSVSFWTYLLVSQAQAMFIDCDLKAIVLNGWWISL